MSEIRAVPLGKRAVNSSVRSIELLISFFYLLLFSFSCLGAGQGKNTFAAFFASLRFATIIDRKYL